MGGHCEDRLRMAAVESRMTLMVHPVRSGAAGRYMDEDYAFSAYSRGNDLKAGDSRINRRTRQILKLLSHIQRSIDTYDLGPEVEVVRRLLYSDQKVPAICIRKRGNVFQKLAMCLLVRMRELSLIVEVVPLRVLSPQKKLKRGAVQLPDLFSCEIHQRSAPANV